VEKQEPSYINMTEEMCNVFAHPEFRDDYAIEPDMSSASYFVAVEYIARMQWPEETHISLSRWPGNSLQVDGKFPEYLPGLRRAGPVHPTKVSRVRDLGDSVMTLAICAVFGEQPLQIVDAAKLRVQETDRIKAMVTELRKVGGEKAAQETDDGFIVNPVPLKELHGAEIETYNDHRMAMCFSVLGLKVPGIRIKNPSCVSKTFPNFFEKLEQLRQA
jgi:3-phosphoshikimate 1-carboxyvinyltransferase